MSWLLLELDALLIAPYRWAEDPMVGFWIGTATLVAAVIALGELSRLLTSRSSGAAEAAARRELLDRHRLSMEALRAGDGAAYRALNRLATGALDRALGLALLRTLAVLWPAALAAAWLELRFGGTVVAELPGLELTALGAFGLLFALARLVALAVVTRVDRAQRRRSGRSCGPLAHLRPWGCSGG